ncbi:MAG: DUF4258 domain-containing protein [Stellaceae bacterium]
MAAPVDDYEITPHAAFEMVRRRIAESVVHDILASPQQRYPVRPGRDVLQSKLLIDGKNYLVRVLIDIDRAPAEVVTVYRTSQIVRYWRVL